MSDDGPSPQATADDAEVVESAACPPRGDGRHADNRRPLGGRDMLGLTVVLVIVAFVTLSMLFGADSRPSPCERPQAWFGRR